MLARVAENLYWIGRYIERAECSMRYIRAEFISTLDAPMTEHRDYVMRSILFLRSSEVREYDHMDDASIWKNAIFDHDNDNSVLCCIKSARENARGIRNTISLELWESINKWYYYCLERESAVFTLKEINDFSEQMTFHLSLIKYSMVNTLLHNQVWHFLNVGLMLERSQQISKILKGKIADYNILSDSGKNESIKIYQWTIMLKSVGAYDAHQNHFRKKLMAPETIFELVLSNKLFPRSIHYSTSKFHKHLGAIKYAESILISNKDIIAHMASNLESGRAYSDEALVIQQLDEVFNYMTDWHFKIQKMFFD